MKKIIPFAIILSAHANFMTAQTFSSDPFNDGYKSFVKAAVEHYNKKEYQLAAENYEKAFAANKGGAAVDDRIKLAGCWALCGNKDSAFKELRKLESARYTMCSELNLNKDLSSLHGDKRWKDITDFVKANRLKYNPRLDRLLVETLDTILENDQKYRQMEQDVKDKYGDKSKELKDLYNLIDYHDSVNVAKVLPILNKYGWPSSSIIGDEGPTTLFLVIQHADITIQEKYLTTIKDAVQKREIPRSYLALLEDRIAISHGRKQIYGTQVGTDKKGNYYLEPLEDPDNVDQRRSEMGLGTLSEYLENWGITWPDKRK